MHNHNSDRLLRGGAQADDRVARALLRTDGVLSRRCANNCRSFVVHTTSTGHVDQPAGGRRVASRRAACATLHAQRNRPHTHTHHSARHAHTSRRRRATRPNVLTCNSVDACMRRGCTHATRRVKPLAGRRSVWRRRRASSCVCAHNTNRIDAHAQPLIHRKTNTVTIMPYIDRCVASQSRAASSRVVRVDKFNKREFAALARDSQSALLMTRATRRGCDHK